MNKYVNPLCERYASEEMQYIFSPDFKFSTWRKLWVNLAKSEQELGLNFITDDMIKEMEENVYNIDYTLAAKYEKDLRHDVMAHVHTFGDLVPNARKIIHLGATSAYVGDNTDIIQIKEGLILVRKKLVSVIERMSKFAEKYKGLPTLGFTHFQAAQLTTVGKRASLWMQSLLYDLEELEFRLDNLKFRGAKGTTGTQASFKELFNDFDKVKKLDELVTEKAGFKVKQTLSSQTYDRKQDTQILQLLSNIAQSVHKITNDFRMLQHLKEIEEPFGKKQIGSSAMAYKRNPMRSERASSLAKFVMANAHNGELVAATQWFERTLDDSADKRLSIPQSFLAIDGILILLLNIFENTVVYEKIIKRNVDKELPFMATENIIMKAVENGMDRQDVHEIIRELSMEAAKNVKLEGLDNNLIELIKKDGRLDIIKDEIDNILEAEKFIGYSKEQIEEFLSNDIKPILEKYKDEIIKISTEIDK
ncbi:adenylosuccinate lyase [Streptobacillus moniliformis]|uniref:Adenylosuccinate lyase n=1 Tax=Streptobacillus moniliformis (strain ATCC 14647 / DSM 12112 / NCTC 10651 / 9901) TaxID=519441 RepID=D1AWY9_STRM9|nr:adenylosuccinate lyase [Streptobacillus moniliformis]ACZ00815.1 adenylosuccinate lyase [Streptobacillus moniliformis DSM 12112]AVL42789.1 adenylosuccinate lyase [Streptobacillus moniliformis]QXW65566.1 adenylosuccinate lyase [Streptobacillus moniliformis]SQA14050.1 Adenylosuccinate lyase [Streptobacillus moniliformis]